MLGDGEVEGSPFPGFGFDPDSSAIALDHPLADSQSDAGAAVFLIVMEPLENTKDFLLVLWIDADAVVLRPKSATRRRASIAEIWIRGASSPRYFSALPIRF